jgi:hypothetical protein
VRLNSQRVAACEHPGNDIETRVQAVALDPIGWIAPEV